MTRPRVLLVTAFATHYNAPVYELLHERVGAEFVFFSRGGEEYWQPHLGVTKGRFPGVTAIGGRSIGSKLHFNTTLSRELWNRDFDVVVKCVGGRVELPMTYAIARAKRSAFVLWTGLWKHPESAFHRLSRPYIRHIYRNADAIVTYGSHVSDFVVSEGAHRESVFEAENATDNRMYGRSVTADEIRAFRELHGLGDQRIVLAVSRLVAQKGLDHLLDAVAGLPMPRPRVVVVGTGDLAEHLRSLAESLAVDLTLIPGLQPMQMPVVYAAADVFAMPSITTKTVLEAWGLACNEAMCQGIPVVATTAVGAVAGGLVLDEQTGLVVPERDSQSLRAAIGRILDDRGLAETLGARGRERVQRTSIEAMVSGFEAAIEHASSVAARRTHTAID